MELNKCKRCGAFFATQDSVCPNCRPKDLSDVYKLKSFLQENDLRIDREFKESKDQSKIILAMK